MSRERDVEKYIVFSLGSLLVVMCIVNILQQMHIVEAGRVEVASVVLVFGALELLVLDIYCIYITKLKILRKSDFVLIFLILSILISTIFSNNIEMALGGTDIHAENTFTLISYIIICFSASLISEIREKKRLYCFLVCIAIIQIIMAVLQVIIQPLFLQETLNDLYFENNRAYGTMENPNPFGSLMILFLGMECSLFVFSESNKTAFFHGIMIVGLFYTLLLSGTRGAMLGFVVGSFICSLIFLFRKRFRFNKIKLLKKVLIIFLIFGIVVTTFSFFNDDTWNGIVGRVKSDTSATGFGTLGTSRVEIWRMCWEKYVVSHPIFGVGVSNVCLTVFMDFILSTYDAHNRYLQILCTQGAFGLVIYIWFNVIILKNTFRKIRNCKNADDFRWLFGLMLAYSSYMLADFFCIGVYALAPFYYVLAGIMMFRKREEEVRYVE